MSDPNFRSRSTGEPRVSIDLDDIERRLRESLEPVAVPPPAPAATPATSSADPLAELARLVGSANADPFSKVFAQPAGFQSPPPAMPRAMPFEPPPVMPTSSSYDPAPFAAPPAYAQPAYGQPAYEPAQSEPVYDQTAYQQQPAYADQGQDHAHDQGHAPWRAQEQGAYDQYADYAQEPPRRTGRAKLLIGAAIVVAAGGLAGAYALRGSGSMGDAPTIMAKSGPVKVQPAKPVEDSSKPTISVLDRGANAPKDSKVVQSAEQPVDLGNAARTGAQRPQRAGEPGAPVTLAPPPPPPVANSLFAEPKKVKAVAVRPDGSIIDPNAPAAPAAATPAPAKPATAAPAAPSKPNDMASLVASTTNTAAEPPKAAARATDVKPAPAPVPAQRPSGGPPMNLAPPVAALAAPAAAAPVQTASATAGTYAVQLVGTTSADEAKAALDRVNTRFRADLGNYRPTIVRAEDAGRTVYRVRVINLSSDDANKLCAKLKSAGGTCFVARS